MILIKKGNKKDLEEKRAVEFKEGQELARKYNFIFTETSALDDSFLKFIEALENSLRSYSKMYKLGM
jgi:hypothetical protein